MAIVPPTYANGTVTNNSEYKPVPWDQIPSANHTTIDVGSMPHSSTVEYKGYFKAQSTGLHTFKTTGSEGITSYAWVSGAPRDSSRIKLNQKVIAQNNTSFGIIIPNPRGSTAPNWRFGDTNVVGTFPGYGYWPKTGYGGSQMPAKFNSMYSGAQTPSTECGYVQTPHQQWLPGDIRRYDEDFPGNFGDQAGAGWISPEEEHFHSPCWDNGSRTTFPMVRIPNTKGLPSDAGTNSTTQGKTNQIGLDINFKAEGTDRENWGKYSVVHVNPNNSNEKFVWLDAVSGINVTGQGKRTPERIMIQFSLKFTKADTYTFEWKTRDSLKLWYRTNITSQGDTRNNRKVEPDTGKNPLNRDSGNTSETGWAPNSWDSSVDDYGVMTHEMAMTKNGYIRYIGSAVGLPDSNTHGFSLVIKDSSGEIVWTADQLDTDSSQIIGIDECGYNALLTENDRALGDDFRDTESFKDDGWNGTTGESYTADFRVGDSVSRGTTDTRQYLPGNSLSRCRGGQNIQGGIYLRQGDYYFIRVIVSNHLNQANLFDFKVTTPTNITQTVEFTGNGDPNSDSSVGGNAGSGVLINTEILCGSSLYALGKDTNDLNFAYIDRPAVGKLVLNLSGGSLNVPTNKIGLEGQKGLVDDTVVQAAGVSLTLAAGTELEESVTLSKLLRGGSDGISEMSPEQIDAAREEYRIQRDTGAVLEWSNFRNAITSKAVIQWGKTGNYQYVYHSVADVIRSICDGETIATSKGNSISTNNTNTNTNTNTGTNSACIDIDYTQLGQGFSQIASECISDCKEPSAFSIPSYTKSSSELQGMIPDYRRAVTLREDYGFDTRKYGESYEKDGQRIAALGSDADPSFYRPGQIHSIPVYIPDVFQDPNIDYTSKESVDARVYDLTVGEISIDFSSNTFSYNPDGAPNQGADYIVIWASVVPGGLPLGDPNASDYQNRGFHITTTRNINSYSQCFFTTIYDKWIASVSGDEGWSKRYTGYLGNKYGARYINVCTMSVELSTTYNFEVPDVGTQEFYDLLSPVGFKSNATRLWAMMPAPDCTTLTPTQSGGGVNPPPNVNTDPISYDEKYEYLGSRAGPVAVPFGGGSGGI